VTTRIIKIEFPARPVPARLIVGLVAGWANGRRACARPGGIRHILGELKARHSESAEGTT